MHTTFTPPHQAHGVAIDAQAAASPYAKQDDQITVILRNVDAIASREIDEPGSVAASADLQLALALYMQFLSLQEPSWQVFVAINQADMLLGSAQ
jgi:hypothetical protein